MENFAHFHNFNTKHEVATISIISVISTIFIFKVIIGYIAQMAERSNAPDCKSGALRATKVQILLCAHKTRSWFR